MSSRRSLSSFLSVALVMTASTGLLLTPGRHVAVARIRAPAARLLTLASRPRSVLLVLRSGSGVPCSVDCGVSDSASSTKAASKVSAKLHQIESQTEKLRGLRELHPVRVVFLDNRDFDRYIAGVYRSANPPSLIRTSDVEAVLAGLLSPRVNLMKILTTGLTQQVVGLYDKHSKRLYIRNTGQALGIDRWTIAHEFTHALQDQHFNLNRVEPDQTHWRLHNSDADLAEHALVEGDAVTIQYAYVAAYYSPSQVIALERQQSSYHSSPVPRIIEEQFDFPYTDGPAFVRFLLDHGGYTSVNAAFRRPPQTTYQVMFDRSIRPAHLDMQGVSGPFRHWQTADDDVNGSFGYQQLVEQYVPASSAVRLASIWRGDRYVLLKHGRQYAMYLESVYAGSRDAGTARGIIQLSLAHRFHRRAKHFSAGIIVGRGHTFAGLVRRGRNVFLSYASSASIAERLAASAPVT